MMRTFIIGALAAVPLILTGCANDSAIEREPVPTTTPTAESEYQLPLARYSTSLDEKLLVQQAASAAAARCAQRFGVAVTPPGIERASIEVQLPHSRRYGLIDLDEATQYGYEMPPQEETVRDDTNPASALGDEVMSGVDADGSPSTLRDQEGNGVPEGGCAAEGWRQVRAEISHDWDALPLQLLDEAHSLMLADEEYQQAETDWAACMTKRGYDFTHRFEAGNSVADKDAQAQRTMAIADTECALEVNFPGRAQAIDVGYQQALIDANEAQLRTVLELKRTLIEQAKDALG